MNSEQLIKKYSAHLGVNEEVGSRHLGVLLGIMEEALLEEDYVLLRGIGKLVSRELAAKRGVTPRGRKFSQPSRLTLRIVPSGLFKQKLNRLRRID